MSRFEVFIPVQQCHRPHILISVHSRNYEHSSISYTLADILIFILKVEKWAFGTSAGLLVFGEMRDIVGEVGGDLCFPLVEVLLVVGDAGVGVGDG